MRNDHNNFAPMAEQRAFSHSICVKTNAKTDVKFELFPAEQWEGGPVGFFRVRKNRCWLEAGSEWPLYLSPERVGALVVQAIAGEETDLRAPAFPKGTAVRVRRDPDNPYSYQRVFTKSDPWRGWDGDWYVLVHIYRRGDVMVPIRLIERIPEPKKLEDKTGEPS